MQWTRDGAHNILQIRASMVSNERDYIWQKQYLVHWELQHNNDLFCVAPKNIALLHKYHLDTIYCMLGQIKYHMRYEKHIYATKPKI